MISALCTIGLMWSLPTNASPHTVSVDVPDAWNFTCEVLAIDCSNIKPPEVVGAENGEGPCNGLTWGGFSPSYPDKIYLCVSPLYYSKQVFIQSVVAHEMAHYLDNIRNPEISDCDTEWNAHRVGNAYVYSHDHKDWADYDWQDWYGCWQPPANDQDAFTVIIGAR